MVYASRSIAMGRILSTACDLHDFIALFALCFCNSLVDDEADSFTSAANNVFWLAFSFNALPTRILQPNIYKLNALLRINSWNNIFLSWQDSFSFSVNTLCQHQHSTDRQQFLLCHVFLHNIDVCFFDPFTMRAPGCRE